MAVSPLSPDRFWELIDATSKHKVSSTAQLSSLRSLLANLTPDEIISFQLAMDKEMARADTWDLAGAAHIVLNGVTDDGFEYFRLWLIARGRLMFEAAVRDPDSLAELLSPKVGRTLNFEELAYVAGEVWSEMSGNDPNTARDEFYDRLGDYYSDVPIGNFEPTGEPYTEDENNLSQRYPELWKKFRKIHFVRKWLSKIG